MTSTAAPQRSSLDLVMRRFLRVSGDPVRGAVFDAENKLKSSLIISGIRCIITYLLVPIVTPIVGFAGVLAAPLSIGLSVTAIVMSYDSLRRFFLADHRLRWRYAAFVAAVWILLAVGIVVDITSLAA